MKIGIIGLGVVGGVLYRWLMNNTKHELVSHDPPKGYFEDLSNSDYIFISVPVPPGGEGQDITLLKEAVDLAKANSKHVFIRSTVLPGTNDMFGTTSMPEFLTERVADQDFQEHPILIGSMDQSLEMDKVFPGKTILRLNNNREAELAKLTHNCFGAMKVTYFNIIEELCQKLGCEYEAVLNAALITGFINRYHTMVPGPDGKRGYGGKCFPENIDAMTRFLRSPKLDMASAELFFDAIDTLNSKHRWCDGLRKRYLEPNENEKI